MDVENAEKDSTSYPIDDGYQSNKNRKCSHFQL